MRREIYELKLNCVLKSKKEIKDAIQNLKRLDLPPHPHYVKSWDTWKIINFIKTHGCEDSKILDVGCNGSPVLPYLHELGFKNLYGCDLNLKSRKPLYLLKIASLVGYKKLKPLIKMFENKNGFFNLEKQNLEYTNYRSNSFDFISSLSVIEHGINIERYFSEMNRILKKNGYLLTSTDYWPEKILSRSNVYRTKGHDVIYDKTEIQDIIKTALDKGFELYEPVNFDHKDRVVYWKKTGNRYTFIFFGLKNRKD